MQQHQVPAHEVQQEDTEVRQSGHVRAGVYAAYANAAGRFLVAIICLSFIFMQVLSA